MPRSPLYRASKLEVDYDDFSNRYYLTRDNNQSRSGSSYNEREVKSLITNLEKSIENDRRFCNTHLFVTKKAKKMLETKVES